VHEPVYLVVWKVFHGVRYRALLGQKYLLPWWYNVQGVLQWFKMVLVWLLLQLKQQQGGGGRNKRIADEQERTTLTATHFPLEPACQPPISSPLGGTCG
jgi:hypothetical protein